MSKTPVTDWLDRNIDVVGEWLLRVAILLGVVVGVGLLVGVWAAVMHWTRL